MSQDPIEILRELIDPPEDAAAEWYRARGLKLEELIQICLEREHLDPRTRYRPDGEEVDGSFMLDGRCFLLEAKWQRPKTRASDLYAFKGKVDGKLTGTIGVFITMNDYSTDAIAALKAGKDINLILFSRGDFTLVVEGKISFVEALRKKLRYAAEEGQPYLPLKEDEKVVPVHDHDVDVAGLLHNRSLSDSTLGYLTRPTPERWDFVVEGLLDKEALARLLKRMRSEKELDIRFWIAGGVQSIPSLVRNIKGLAQKNRIVVVADADTSPKQIEELAKERVRLFVASPTLEEWLTAAVPANMYNAMPATSVREKEMRRLGAFADISILANSNAEFAALLNDMNLRQS